MSGPTTEWREKAHRPMGSFLHRRTIAQLNRGNRIDEAILGREAARVVAPIDYILASEVPGMRLSTRL
jgi:hypothetical protein